MNIDHYLSNEQAGMLFGMRERVRERSAGWKVHILDKFFPLTSLHYPAIIGSFAWSSVQIKRKWLLECQAYDYGAGWVTPGDIARDYLALKYPNRRIRITTSQWLECVRGRVNPPLFCNPSRYEQGYYVDITSAYWSIVQAVGWDVNYNPGKFLCAQSDMEDFPFPKEKMARNCLVSVGLNSPMRLWTGSELTFVKKPNRFINLVLWRLVCDVLNGVAADAIDAGCDYVYTDGFITDDKHLENVLGAISAWGLPCRIKKEGRTEIHAPAVYTIDGISTKVKPRSKDISIRKVSDVNRSWLRWRFARFANERIKTP